MPKDRPWIVARDGTHGRDAYAMECMRCGCVQRFAMPISVSVYVAAAKAFERQHARCKSSDSQPTGESKP